MAMAHLLVVGLGNAPYPLTRHSVGQLIVDSLASTLGIHMSSSSAGVFGESTVSIGETRLKLSLFKSKSLMNISGPSIAAVCRKTVKTPASMVVLSDSLAHNVETLSVRLGGSANGHNGLKSIIAALGNQSDFHRFRIGIGRTQLDAATYVLAKMPTHERQFWANGRGYDMVLEELEKVARKVGP